MTYYLKYRPQTINSLDLASARKELGAILASGRFSHAYLFAGPRGTGKTSAARILAKVVNCVKNKGIARFAPRLVEPCNICVSCKSITEGRALDLIEIDAASNRGIDDVRELRERIKLAPAQSRFKVYIIDEVHMLTNEAFNALLKTLEEPPEHALFILCTTAPEKLPATVLSRCTRITFRKASLEEVVRSLMKVVSGEKLKVADGVLEAIAGSVDGSFRDGMKILEQLSLRTTGRGSKQRAISLADVVEVVGIVGGDEARMLVKLLVAGRSRDAFVLLTKVDGQQSVDHFIRETLELLRRLLLTEIGVADEEKIAGLDLTAVKKLIALFSTAASQMQTAVISILPLEIAVAEWFVDRETVGTSESTSTRITAQAGKHKRSPPPKGSTSKAGSRRTVPAKPQGREQKAGISLAEAIQRWPQVLARVRPQNHSLEALLKAASPKALKGDVLTIEVAYPFHKQQLELNRYKTVVELALAEVLSTHLNLQYVLREVPGRLQPERRENENITTVNDEELMRAAQEIFGKGEE